MVLVFHNALFFCAGFFVSAVPAAASTQEQTVHGYDLNWRANSGAACGSYAPSPPNGGWWGRKFWGPVAAGDFSSCTADVPVPANFLRAKVKRVTFKIW